MREEEELRRKQFEEAKRREQEEVLRKRAENAQRLRRLEVSLLLLSSLLSPSLGLCLSMISDLASRLGNAQEILRMGSNPAHPVSFFPSLLPLSPPPLSFFYLLLLPTPLEVSVFLYLQNHLGREISKSRRAKAG